MSELEILNVKKLRICDSKEHFVFNNFCPVILTHVTKMKMLMEKEGIKCQETLIFPPPFFFFPESFRD